MEMNKMSKDCNLVYLLHTLNEAIPFHVSLLNQYVQYAQGFIRTLDYDGLHSALLMARNIVHQIIGYTEQVKERKNLLMERDLPYLKAFSKQQRFITYGKLNEFCKLDLDIKKYVPEINPRVFFLKEIISIVSPHIIKKLVMNPTMAQADHDVVLIQQLCSTANENFMIDLCTLTCTYAELSNEITLIGIPVGTGISLPVTHSIYNQPTLVTFRK